MLLKGWLKRKFYIIKLHRGRFLSEKAWKSYILQKHLLAVEKIKSRLENVEEKLHIVFYVCEKSKWNCQKIYEILKKHPKVKLTFVLDENDVTSTEFISKDRAREINQKNYDFYRSIDGNVNRTFDDGTGLPFIKLEDINPDIIFFQQPWGKMGEYPAKLLGKALGVYIPYFYIIMDWDEGHFNRVPFNYYLWKYFAQTKLHKQMHLKFDPLAEAQIVVTGYPKLDVFYEEIRVEANVYWKVNDSKVKRIVYAPHHSVGDSNLKMSTFEYYYKEFLSLAKSNPNFQWVYKPHPTILKSVVQFGIMSQDEYLNYVKEWNNLPNSSVNEEGNYFDLFRTSDALITDSISFLAEYLPTKKPILQLMRDGSAPLNQVGVELTRNYYKATSFQEIQTFLENIVTLGNDNLKEERLKALDVVMPSAEEASQVIIQSIFTEIGLD